MNKQLTKAEKVEQIDVRLQTVMAQLRASNREANRVLKEITK